MIAQDAEAKVYYADDNTSVVKERTSIYSTWHKALDAIVLHNCLFPETIMTVIGFTRDSDGLMRIVLTHPYVNCERLAYNTQLGVTIEKLEPVLERTCYVSVDSEAVYNPMAIPIYARAEKPTKALSLVRSSTAEAHEVTPGQSRFITLHHIFEYNLEKAYDECMGMTDANEHHHLLLTRLAIHCLETGIPMAIAKRMTRYRAYGIGDDDLLIDKVFGNVYRPELVKRYEEPAATALRRTFRQKRC
jgi:hypothetical protein